MHEEVIPLDQLEPPQGRCAGPRRNRSRRQVDRGTVRRIRSGSYHDQYQERIRELIDAKRTRQETEAKAAARRRAEGTSGRLSAVELEKFSETTDVAKAGIVAWMAQPRRQPTPAQSKTARSRGPKDLPLHAFWSGSLSFGLVNVPVLVFPATRHSGVRLRMIGPSGYARSRGDFIVRATGQGGRLTRSSKALSSMTDRTSSSPTKSSKTWSRKRRVRSICGSS